jgi:LysM repeat protein
MWRAASLNIEQLTTDAGTMHGARTAALGLILTILATPCAAQTLRGSKTTMVKQNRIAVDHDYTFLRNRGQVSKFVDMGLLVPVRGNANYELATLRHPYARPALKLFIERLAAQYKSACGERLVVTSLTRPLDEQPRNASDLSVHPTGMAVDLRVSKRASCRSWLERTLLSLERQGVLDAIREQRPPHYHVALFPSQYVAYVEQLTNGSVRVAASGSSTGSVAQADEASADVLETASLEADGADGSSTVEVTASDPAPSRPASTIDYRVTRGETLWSIARRHGTTVEAIRTANGLTGSRLDPGQILAIPIS